MPTADAAIENVIRQFSDPLAFFRELIQNAIDAGSKEVEIDFDHDPSTRMATITIADWGEGMTREIVESRLVRLFSSHKDDDFTKIGKFGIGFVSVFAIEPELVCVDTGRDGEWLRILFHPDRTYELIALDAPVEGTSVRLIRRMTLGEFDDLRRRAREAVESWCRYVDVPVYFEGEDIRRRFDLDGILTATLQEEGTRAVVALRRETHCGGALFHSGLALIERPSQWDHVEYILDSRYLKHTLTRDQIIADKNYQAAMDRLDELIQGKLRSVASEALETWPLDDDRRWDWENLCAAGYGAFGGKFGESIRWPTVGRELATTKECAKARRRQKLFLSRGVPSFAHELPDDLLILDVRPDSASATVLWSSLGDEIPSIEEAWAFVKPVDRRAQPGAEALVSELAQVLNDVEVHPLSIQFADLDYPHSPFEGRIAVTAPRTDQPLPTASYETFDPHSTSGHVLLNVSSETVDQAIAAAAREPELAAYTLFKICALGHDAVEKRILTPERDVELATALLDRRADRTARRGE